MYGVVCLQLAYFSSRWLKGYIYSSRYYHHQIGSIHLSHCYHIFSVAVCLRCLLHHILSLIAYTFRENRECVFIIIVQFMMSANIWTRLGLQIVLVCLYTTPSHYNQCANLSEGIVLIKCLSGIFCQVCKIKHVLTVIHYTIYGAVCFQFTHFSCDDWDNIYTLSYYHHQTGSMIYYPLFNVRSWNNGVRYMSFYILLNR